MPSLSPGVGISFHFRLNARPFVPLKHVSHGTWPTPLLYLSSSGDRVLPP